MTVVCLFDSDNALLDNDRVEVDLPTHPEREFRPKEPGAIRGHPGGSAGGVGADYSKNVVAYGAADLTVERIGDLVDCELPALLGTALGGPSTNRKQP